MSGLAIFVDARPMQVPSGCTLSDLLVLLGHSPDAVATAVDGLFVARATRQGRLLQDGDQVLLFHPVVGG